MTDQNILEKYPNVPKNFIAAISSPFFGGDGGNKYSPIWFSGLEWGKGFDETEDGCCKQYSYFCEEEDKSISIHKDSVKKYLKADWGNNTSHSEIYPAYVMLLTTIINNRLDCTGSLSELENLVDKFEFFSDRRYGLLLNAFPVSMPARDKEDNYWKERKLVKRYKESKELTTFADWTTISNFDDYKTWTAFTRRSAFCSARKKYHPALVYCGGIKDADKFFTMWTDEENSENRPIQEYLSYAEGKPSMRLQYCWVKNNPGDNDTLLVVGYSFSSQWVQSCLGGDPNKSRALGTFLRQKCDEHFNDGGAWLQREKFDPTYHN